MRNLREMAVLSELVSPEMANFHGTMFGGELLALVDKAAYVVATRWCGGDCVTASLDQVAFIEPVRIGELISLHAHIAYVGTSSMTIRIEVFAEELVSGQERRVCECFATMVALEDGRPRRVPQLDCEGPEQKRDCLLGYLRKKLLRERQERLTGLSVRIEAMSDAEIVAALAAPDACGLC